MTLYYIALAACVISSAFFSASEMSISSANRLRLENMRKSTDYCVWSPDILIEY